MELEKIYGAWITPNGKVIDVVDYYGHEKVCSYMDAYHDGWIGITYGEVVGMSIRIEPTIVNSSAIRSLLKLISEYRGHQFYLSDIFMKRLPGFKHEYDLKGIRESIRKM